MKYFLFALVLVGCSEYQILDPDKGLYKRDVGLTINGKEYLGVSSVPHAAQYNMTLKPKGALDLILIKTCHRTFSAEKKDKGFLGIGGGQFQYLYTPKPPMETDRVCPMRIDVYESSAKGRQSWALIDFENQAYKLGYRLICDGSTVLVNGVGVCQALEKTWQRLEFSEPVRFAPVEPSYCAIPVKSGENAYEISAAKGECLYHFDTHAGEVGRLTLVGYTGVLIREGQ